MLRWTLEYTCLFQFWFPQCVCPGVGLLGCMAVLFPVFKGTSTLFSIVAELVCIPANSVRGLLFLWWRFKRWQGRGANGWGNGNGSMGWGSHQAENLLYIRILSISINILRIMRARYLPVREFTNTLIYKHWKGRARKNPRMLDLNWKYWCVFITHTHTHTHRKIDMNVCGVWVRCVHK